MCKPNPNPNSKPNPTPNAKVLLGKAVHIDARLRGFKALGSFLAYAPEDILTTDGIPVIRLLCSVVEQEGAIDSSNSADICDQLFTAAVKALLQACTSGLCSMCLTTAQFSTLAWSFTTRVICATVHAKLSELLAKGLNPKCMTFFTMCTLGEGDKELHQLACGRLERSISLWRNRAVKMASNPRDNDNSRDAHKDNVNGNNSMTSNHPECQLQHLIYLLADTPSNTKAFYN